MFTSSATVEVNPPGDEPILTTTQVWDGSLAKTRDPTGIVPGATRIKIVAEYPDGLLRRMEVGGETIRERITITPMVQVLSTRVDSPGNDGFIINILGDLDGRLVLTFIVAVSFAGIPPTRPRSERPANIWAKTTARRCGSSSTGLAKSDRRERSRRVDSWTPPTDRPARRQPVGWRGSACSFPLPGSHPQLGNGFALTDEHGELTMARSTVRIKSEDTAIPTGGDPVMKTVVAGARLDRLAKFLTVLSVACFCLPPFSHLVSIGAVSMTAGMSGWPRRFALIGATLCIAYTLVLAVAVVRLYLLIP